MSPEDQAIAYTANFTCVAVTILVNCLKDRGVLGATEFEDEIRNTLLAGRELKGRLDYQFLETLLKALETKASGSSPAKVLLN